MCAKLGKSFDGVLRVVIIPRNTIVIQEGEHLCATLVEPLLVAGGEIRREILRSHRVQESKNSWFVLVQVSAHEAVTVHCLYYRSQKRSELLGDAFQFCVEWILEQIFVDVAYEMHEAFLLLTVQRIISRVEV